MNPANWGWGRRRRAIPTARRSRRSSAKSTSRDEPPKIIITKELADNLLAYAEGGTFCLRYVVILTLLAFDLLMVGFSLCHWYELCVYYSMREQLPVCMNITTLFFHGYASLLICVLGRLALDFMGWANFRWWQK